MSEMKRNLAAPCGLYCGVCAIRIAHRDDNLKLKESLVGRFRGVLPNTDDLTADDIHCQGCLSDDLFLHCRQCDIRNCALEKGFSGCHQCDDFPCAHIDNFPTVVGRKVISRAIPRRRAVGTEQWIIEEETRYTCPQCGAPTFRGATRCGRCRTELALD